MTTLTTAGRQAHADTHEGRRGAQPASAVYALLADGATAEIRPATVSDFDAVWQMHRAMSADNIYLRFFSRLMKRMREQAARSDPLAGLTGQERQILELIGEGLTNREIGERMFLAEKTIKNYVSALFTKLGMERRTQAAAYAARVFGDQEHPEKD
jgi:DNA-binding NarL/FixJ family response regulator